MSWANGALTIEGPPNSPSRRFVLGRRGDELLIGAWDCQTAPAPAIYRPATGQVFVWHEWAAPGRPVAPGKVVDTGIYNGVATVVTTGGRACQEVSVRAGPPSRRSN